MKMLLGSRQWVNPPNWELQMVDAAESLLVKLPQMMKNAEALNPVNGEKAHARSSLMHLTKLGGVSNAEVAGGGRKGNGNSARASILYTHQ